MPGINLTRDEARDRSSMVEVDSYEIELDVTTGEKTFGSVTTVRFRCPDDAQQTWLDFIAPTVGEVVLNGTPLDPMTVYDGSRIKLEGLQPENEVTVVAEAAYMHTGEGLHRFVDPVDSRRTSTPSSRCRTPAGCSPASSSRT